MHVLKGVAFEASSSPPTGLLKGVLRVKLCRQYSHMAIPTMMLFLHAAYFTHNHTPSFTHPSRTSMVHPYIPSETQVPKMPPNVEPRCQEMSLRMEKHSLHVGPWFTQPALKERKTLVYRGIPCIPLSPAPYIFCLLCTQGSVIEKSTPCTSHTFSHEEKPNKQEHSCGVVWNLDSQEHAAIYVSGYPGIIFRSMSQQPGGYHLVRLNMNVLSYLKNNDNNNPQQACYQFGLQGRIATMRDRARGSVLRTTAHTPRTAGSYYPIPPTCRSDSPGSFPCFGGA